MLKIVPFFFLILLSALFRFSYLGTIPVSLSHDEVDMVIQAHSARLTASDLSGSWHPSSVLPNDAVMAELAPLVNAPLLSLLPNSLFAAHATTALLGSVYPILIVILLMQWGWGSRVSWLSGVLLATSPWHILFSRTTLEQPTSLFFYTLSWICLNQLFALKKATLAKIVLTTLSFTLTYALGFYTYHGFKFALPILTGVLTLYHFYRSRLLLPLFLVGMVIGGLYVRLYMNLDSYKSRGSEIIFLDAGYFAKQVDLDRRLSLLPSGVTELMTNKVTNMASLVVDKYVAALSPSLLFTQGEPNGVFGTGRTGYLYLVLAPFLIFGLVELVATRPSRNMLLLSLLALAPLATVLHVNNAIAFRSAIYFVLLTVTTAVGLVQVQTMFPRIKLIAVTLLLVAVSLAHFSYVYLAFYPVESARAYFMADRTLATYLSHRSNEKMLVIDPQPRYIMSYLALTQERITKETIQPLLGNYSPSEEQNSYQLGNVTIRRDCPTEFDTYETIIVDSSLEAGIVGRCESLDTLIQTTKGVRKQITDPFDGGDKKIIFNDKLCINAPVSTYINPKNHAVFALDDLSQSEFCKAWITER
jgi:hypothetical protein